jgi:hypothetical protein
MVKEMRRKCRTVAGVTRDRYRPGVSAVSSSTDVATPTASHTGRDSRRGDLNRVVLKDVENHMRVVRQVGLKAGIRALLLRGGQVIQLADY